MFGQKKQEARRPAGAAEFGGRSATDYVGKVVAVPHGGRWEKATIKSATIEGGLLKLDTNVGPMTLDTPPEMVEFDNNYFHLDEDGNQVFSVTSSSLDNLGHVHYDVLDENGEENAGIPQEMLLMWRDTVDLEKTLSDQRQAIDALRMVKKTKFLGMHADLQKKVRELWNLMPAGKDIPEMKRKDMEQLAARMLEKKKQADEVVKQLDDILAEESKSMGPEKVFVDAADFDTFTPTSEEQKKLGADRKSFAEIAQAQLAERIKLRLEGELKTKRDNARQSSQQQAQPAQQQDQQQGQQGKKQKEQKPQQGEVQLTEAEKTRFTEEEKTNYFENIYVNAEPAFIEAVDNLRRKEAARAVRVDSSRVEGTGAAMDFVDLEKSGENRKAIEKILAEWLKGTPPVAEAPREGEKVFDFDKEIAGIVAEIARLSALTKEGSASRRDLDGLKKQIEDDKKNFATLEKAARQDDTVNSEDELHQKRVEIVGLAWTELEVLAPDIYAGESAPAEEELSTEAVNIPAIVMERLLESRTGEVKEAERAIYVGGVDDKGNVTPTALEKFKQIFPEQPTPELLEKLRESGMTDWGKFKKRWDKKLAAETAAVMAERARRTLEKKVVEDLTIWDKLGAVKNQMIGRVAANGVLIGATQFGIRTGIDHLAGGLGGAIEPVVGAAAQLAGGGAGGAVKFGVFKRFFGREKAKKEMAEKQQALNDQKKKEIIDKLLGEEFGKAGGLADFGDALSHALLDKTTGEVEVGGKKLTGTQFARFERGMRQARALIPEGMVLSSEAERALANVAEMMIANGNSLTAKMDSEGTIKNNAYSLVDRVVGAYTGKGNWKEAVAANMGVSALFISSATLTTSVFDVTGIVRGTFGAAMGGYGGKEMARGLQEKWERNYALANIRGRMTDVRATLKKIDKREELTPEEAEKFRTDTVGLRSILMGKAQPEIMAGVIYLEGKGEKKGKGEKNESLEDALKRMKVDEELLARIDRLVNDAENTPVFEQMAVGEGDITEKLNNLVDAMQETGKVAADKLPILKRLERWAKTGKKVQVAGALAGAATGYVTFVAAGYAVPVALWAGKKFLDLAHISPAEAAMHPADNVAPTEPQHENAPVQPEPVEPQPAVDVAKLHELAVVHEGEGPYSQLKRQLVEYAHAYSGDKVMLKQMGFKGSVDNAAAVDRWAGSKAMQIAEQKGWYDPSTKTATGIAYDPEHPAHLDLTFDPDKGFDAEYTDEVRLITKSFAEEPAPAPAQARTPEGWKEPQWGEATRAGKAPAPEAPEAPVVSREGAAVAAHDTLDAVRKEIEGGMMSGPAKADFLHQLEEQALLLQQAVAQGADVNWLNNFTNHIHDLREGAIGTNLMPGVAKGTPLTIHYGAAESRPGVSGGGVVREAPVAPPVEQFGHPTGKFESFVAFANADRQVQALRGEYSEVGDDKITKFMQEFARGHAGKDLGSTGVRNNFKHDLLGFLSRERTAGEVTAPSLERHAPAVKGEWPEAPAAPAEPKATGTVPAPEVRPPAPAAPEAELPTSEHPYVVKLAGGEAEVKFFGPKGDVKSVQLNESLAPKRINQAGTEMLQVKLTEPGEAPRTVAGTLEMRPVGTKDVPFFVEPSLKGNILHRVVGGNIETRPTEQADVAPAKAAGTPAEAGAKASATPPGELTPQEARYADVVNDKRLDPLYGKLDDLLRAKGLAPGATECGIEEKGGKFFATVRLKTENPQGEPVEIRWRGGLTKTPFDAMKSALKPETASKMIGMAESSGDTPEV